MNIVLVVGVILILLAGFEAEALSYDYSVSIECLATPHKPQYNGGIIQNPEFNDGLQGWKQFGEAKIELRESLGNKYVVAYSRSQSYDSVSQKISLKKGMYYTLSAWIQVSEGNIPVAVVVKTSKEFKYGGTIYAESKCWSMLKGGFISDTSEEADLYFESSNTAVEIWIDSVALQPFTEKQWESHQYQSIEKARKSKILVQAIDKQGHPLPNASSQLQHLKMKWYTNEYAHGKENYFQADQMLSYAKSHNIYVRGHNIFWEDPKYQPNWVTSLSPNQLNNAVQKRVNAIVQRYKGQVIGWDVINENLRFSFFESKLGQNFSAKIFNEVHDIDAKATLFLNEFNTIEDSRDVL
ncbi:endo-1,4-beta-xylanase [Trifolium repens]|nr:endo-1,4-beta-xylanase [Trifolium repens]